eukprot:CAMPEP_0114460006 /NCGR_PEP_ID=MMETSP0104-20121206/5512_1 /TAXON_ID=37642 ORGANISM="Paraphysomonas imperforata, Strain PA2" /NCGR_SAMPLE_ID=MMETSP0104 /ASSEMBLY_ACC=CAM_ASM_000202 /LENGTH=180 /DNA_ID=CAMNT_0001632683 /DNA_START=103 /DNA_END=642 /DNA_ORIENTATION=+
MSVSANEATKQSVMDILKSMGVTEYDPAVLVALEEYGRRIATDLLCDAKDFSVHASRKKIDIEDIKLAIMLKDKKKKMASPLIKAQQDAQINQQELPPFPADGSTINPANFPSLQTRPYTFVPGSTAYDNESEATVLPDQEPRSSHHVNNKSGAAKKQIPIIMHPEKRGTGANSEDKKRV